MTKKTKKIFFYAWLLGLIVILSFYGLNPDFFAAENLKLIFTSHLALALLIYFILGVVRGLTLVPLTPLLLAGILVFPPGPLFLVTMAGMLISSVVVYYWSKFLGFDQYFQEKYPQQLHKIKTALQKNELPVIVIWAFLPFAPTDIICYACEILKIKLWKCLLGVTIGEGVICAIYIFAGTSLLKFIV